MSPDNALGLGLTIYCMLYTCVPEKNGTEPISNTTSTTISPVLTDIKAEKLIALPDTTETNERDFHGTDALNRENSPSEGDSDSISGDVGFTTKDPFAAPVSGVVDQFGEENSFQDLSTNDPFSTEMPTNSPEPDKTHMKLDSRMNTENLDTSEEADPEEHDDDGTPMSTPATTATIESAQTVSSHTNFSGSSDSGYDILTETPGIITPGLINATDDIETISDGDVGTGSDEKDDTLDASVAPVSDATISSEIRPSLSTEKSTGEFIPTTAQLPPTELPDGDTHVNESAKNTISSEEDAAADNTLIPAGIETNNTKGALDELDLENHGDNDTITSTPAQVPTAESTQTPANTSGSTESEEILTTPIINNIDPVTDNKTTDPVEESSSTITEGDVQDDKSSIVNSEASTVTTPDPGHAIDDIGNASDGDVGTGSDKKDDTLDASVAPVSETTISLEIQPSLNSSTGEINPTTTQLPPTELPDGDAHVHKSEESTMSSVEESAAINTLIPAEIETNDSKSNLELDFEKHADNDTVTSTLAPMATAESTQTPANTSGSTESEEILTTPIINNIDPVTDNKTTDPVEESSSTITEGHVQDDKSSTESSEVPTVTTPDPGHAIDDIGTASDGSIGTGSDGKNDTLDAPVNKHTNPGGTSDSTESESITTTPTTLLSNTLASSDPVISDNKTVTPLEEDSRIHSGGDLSGHLEANKTQVEQDSEINKGILAQNDTMIDGSGITSVDEKNSLTENVGAHVDVVPAPAHKNESSEMLPIAVPTVAENETKTDSEVDFIKNYTASDVDSTTVNTAEAPTTTVAPLTEGLPIGEGNKSSGSNSSIGHENLNAPLVTLPNNSTNPNNTTLNKDTGGNVSEIPDVVVEDKVEPTNTTESDVGDDRVNPDVVALPNSTTISPQVRLSPDSSSEETITATTQLPPTELPGDHDAHVHESAESTVSSVEDAAADNTLIPAEIETNNSKGALDELDLEKHGNNDTITSTPAPVPTAESTQTPANTSGSTESEEILTTPIINNIDPVTDNKTTDPVEESSSTITEGHVQDNKSSTESSEVPTVTTPDPGHAIDDIGTASDGSIGTGSDGKDDTLDASVAPVSGTTISLGIQPSLNSSTGEIIPTTTQLPPIELPDGDAHVHESAESTISSVEDAAANNTLIPAEIETNNTKGALDELDLEKHGNNDTITSTPAPVPTAESTQTPASTSGSTKSGEIPTTPIINNINPVTDNKTTNPVEEGSSTITRGDIQNDEFSTESSEAPMVTTPIPSPVTDNIGAESDKNHDKLNSTRDNSTISLEVQSLSNSSSKGIDIMAEPTATTLPPGTKTVLDVVTLKVPTVLRTTEAPRNILPVPAALTSIVPPPEVLYMLSDSPDSRCGRIQDLPSGWSTVNMVDLSSSTTAPDVFPWDDSADDIHS